LLNFEEIYGMAGKFNLKFTLNGKSVEAEILPNTLLVDLLRNHFGLTGTKVGCGTGECGACTVLMDGKPVNSCLILAIQADGHSVTTIEGLPDGTNLTPVQKCLVEEGAIQCGFCTPGFVISATALLRENPSPTEDEICTAISGNLCRCTGYQRVVQAIKNTTKKMSGSIDKG